jgi:hypothetical protein
MNDDYKNCPRCNNIRQWLDGRAIVVGGVRVICNPALKAGDVYMIDYMALHKMHQATVVEVA